MDVQVTVSMAIITNPTSNMEPSVNWTLVVLAILARRYLQVAFQGLDITTSFTSVLWPALAQLGGHVLYRSLNVAVRTSGVKTRIRFASDRRFELIAPRRPQEANLLRWSFWGTPEQQGIEAVSNPFCYVSDNVTRNLNHTHESW